MRGLQRLIEEDTYCIDVLTQISATTRALQGVALALMDDHLRHCVAQAAVGDPADAEEKLAEASAGDPAAGDVMTDTAAPTPQFDLPGLERLDLQVTGHDVRGRARPGSRSA